MKTDYDNTKGLKSHDEPLRIEGHDKPQRLCAHNGDDGIAPDPIITASEAGKVPCAVKCAGIIMAILGTATIVMLFLGYRHHSYPERPAAVVTGIHPVQTILTHTNKAIDPNALEAVINSQDYTTYSFTASPKPTGNTGQHKTIKGIYDPTTGMVYLFRYGSADVDENSALNDFARNASEAGYNVEIRGYADPRGRTDCNQRLSERRARAIGAYLCKHGVNAKRIKAKGMGQTDAYGSHDQDRRAEIHIVR